MTHDLVQVENEAPNRGFTATPQPQSVPLPASSPVLPSSTQLPPKSPDMFIPYQPDGPPPMAATFHGPVQFLPPNTGTPSPAKRAGHAFTATSAIPFAPRPADKSHTGPGPSLPARDENQLGDKPTVPSIEAPEVKSEPLQQSVWDAPMSP